MRQAGGAGFVPVSVDSVPLDYSEAGATATRSVCRRETGSIFVFSNSFSEESWGLEREIVYYARAKGKRHQVHGSGVRRRRCTAQCEPMAS